MESLTKLKEAGIDITVISPVEQALIVRQIKEAGLGALIPEERVVGNDDMSLLETLRDAHVLYFGKRPECLELAKDAGARVCGLLSGISEAGKDISWGELRDAGVDYIIDDWGIALRWLEALLSASAPRPGAGAMRDNNILLTGI
jgi:phosphoglycolate phosphatase-like HAD superfamily hydrolase